MKHINNTLLAIVSTSLVLSACSGMDDSKTTEAQGAGIGAIFGAVIGKELCSSSNDILCMAVGGAIGAAAGGAYGRKIAKQKQKYVKLEDFYGKTIHEVTNDNIQLVRQNNILKKNISSIRNRIRVAKTSSVSSARKRTQLAGIKKGLDTNVRKNNNLIKKYNGSLAYARAVLDDLQREAALNKKNARNAKSKSKIHSASKVASQHRKLKFEIVQLKSNIARLENQNVQLAALDPSII